MNKEQSLEALIAHRENLICATNFEEWKAAHIKFLNVLIKDYEIELDRYNNIATYVNATWERVNDQ